MFNTELLALLEKSEDCVTWDEGILLALRYADKNRAVCLCAYNGIGRETLERFFRGSAEEIMRKYIENMAAEIPAKPEHIRFIIDFYTDSLAGAAVHWLQDPEGRTPEQVVEMLDITLRGNIRAALERSANS